MKIPMASKKFKSIALLQYCNIFKNWTVLQYCNTFSDSRILQYWLWLLTESLVHTNRNFDKIFVFVFVFNTKEVPGVRKVFICFEISKIFLNLPKKFDNLTVIKSGNSLVLEKKLCKVSWNHLKCKREWMLMSMISMDSRFL